jgi:HSP20 family molecular chaperone IbpA
MLSAFYCLWHTSCAYDYANLKKLIIMITNYPITRGFIKDIDYFVSQALNTAAPLSCGSARCSVEERRDTQNDENKAIGWNLRFELPGFNKDEVKVEIDDEYINMHAKTDDESRSFLGEVKKRVRISDQVDTQNIGARLDNGILYLKISKKVKAKQKAIVIK